VHTLWTVDKYWLYSLAWKTGRLVYWQSSLDSYL
jgi:hypothetical protein